MMKNSLSLPGPRKHSPWRLPLIASVGVHLALLAAVTGALLLGHAPRPPSNGSPEAVLTLSLTRPVASPVSAPAPTVPVPVAIVVPAPAKPPVPSGVPVLAAQPESAAPIASPPPPVVHHHRTRLRHLVAASAAPTAPVATSFAPGADVFPHPPYPDEARDRRETGTVTVEVLFDAAGGVNGVQIVQSSGSFILDRATTTFIRANWHSPAEAGQTVSVPVRYSLQNL